MAQTPCIYRQTGKVIDHTPGSDVAQGAVIVKGTRLVTIAPRAISANVKGEVATDGIWLVPKNNGDFAVGDPVYWDDNGSPYGGTALSGAFSKVAADGPFAGWCLTAAGTTTGTCEIMLQSLDAADELARSAITQEDLVPYPIPLRSFVTTADAMIALGASAGTPAGAMGITIGTHGTAPPILIGEAASNNSKTDKCRVMFAMPPEYVAGQTVTLRGAAKETVGAATVSTTIDAEVYAIDKIGGISADLCATSAIDVTTSVGNKDFTITPTDLEAGDVLDIELTGVTNDTGGAVGTILAIYSVDVLLDIKG